MIKDEIKDVTLLRTENMVLVPGREEKDDKIRKLMSDLVFKVDCGDKNIINVEMQLSNQKEFPERLMNYGTTVKTANDNAPIMVLGFLNSGDFIKTSCYSLAKFNTKMDYMEKIDGFINAIIINLKEISEKLSKNEDIYIFGNKINTLGKDWLKLLSLRHWAIPVKN